MVWNKSVLILGGGRGTRLGGVNKLELKYRGDSFLENIIKELYEYRVFLSLNKGQRDIVENTPVKAEVIYDEVEDIGPIEGIYQGLKRARAMGIEELLVVSGDSPKLVLEFLDYLYEFKSIEWDIVIPVDRGGRAHPLIGIYSVDIIEELEASIEAREYKMFSLLDRLRVKYVELKYTKFSDEILKNINTKADYMGLRRKVLAVSGIKNSGKTSLIEKLVKRFREDSLSVGTIKHDGHDFTMDNTGSDTDKHIKAGASSTLIYSKSKMVYIKKEVSIDYDSLENYLDYFKDVDVVLLEGFKNSDIPKIEVIRDGVSKTSVSKDPIFYVTDIEEMLEDERVDTVDIEAIEEIYNRIQGVIGGVEE